MTLPSLFLPSLNTHWMPCSQQMVGAFWSSGRATHLTAQQGQASPLLLGVHAFFQALHARFLSGHGSAAECAFPCDTDLPLCCLCSTRTEALQSLQSTFLQARERAQVHVNSQMPDARAKPLHSGAPAAKDFFGSRSLASSSRCRSADALPLTYNAALRPAGTNVALLVRPAALFSVAVITGDCMLTFTWKDELTAQKGGQKHTSSSTVQGTTAFYSAHGRTAWASRCTWEGGAAFCIFFHPVVCSKQAQGDPSESKKEESNSPTVPV